MGLDKYIKSTEAFQAVKTMIKITKMKFEQYESLQSDQESGETEEETGEETEGEACESQMESEPSKVKLKSDYSSPSDKS